MASDTFKKEFTQRFNEVVSYLKRSNVVNTNTEIAKLIEQPLQVVSKLISGERIITLEQTSALSRNAGININWLLTGKGTMLLADDSSVAKNGFRDDGADKKSSILDDFSVEEIITYIHINEKDRAFYSNETYKMFLEIRLQRRIIETMRNMELQDRGTPAGLNKDIES